MTLTPLNCCDIITSVIHLPATSVTVKNLITVLPTTNNARFSNLYTKIKLRNLKASNLCFNDQNVFICHPGYDIFEVTIIAMIKMEKLRAGSSAK